MIYKYISDEPINIFAEPITSVEDATVITDQNFNIPKDLYLKLQKLGIIPNETREYNIGESNYSDHVIQPWSIWKDYNLNPWDADIVKRVLRTKKEPGKSKIESRIMDYEKIIHICKERIRQLKYE